MSEKPKSGERDYSQTLFLPQTELPMRAGLPQREPEILARWKKLGRYERLRQEFERLGVEGDWDHPDTTMSFPAEAQIARELMKFAGNGTLYRGSKPVMWSVVEKTALAEAEVEYEDYTSDTVWVKFPVIYGTRITSSEGIFRLPDESATNYSVKTDPQLEQAAVIIWTTTPWTLPGNRAISFSRKIPYSLFKVTTHRSKIGQSPATCLCLPTSLRMKFSSKLE